VPLLPQVIESIRSRDSPKTIVGFLVAMYGILVAGSGAAAVGLANTDKSGLVPYILVFIAVITVALGVAVLVITWKDPSRLMLGQVSGREYAAIRYIAQGDDASGERLERLLGSGEPGAAVVEAPPEATGELPSGQPPAGPPSGPDSQEQT